MIFLTLIIFCLETCVLHLWIHALTFLLKIATHLRAGHLKYTETADIKPDCDRALKEIQQVDPSNCHEMFFNICFQDHATTP